MKCSASFRIALFVVYTASVITALANPADLNFEDAYLMTQGANIATLLALAYCKQTPGDAFVAAVLGVAFTLRATGRWQGGSRWDSLLVTVGMLIILQDAFYAMLPTYVRYRLPLYLGFSCMVLPVLSSLPHLLAEPQVEPEVVRQALRLSSEAYGISNDVDTLLGAAWKLYAADTDTSAGVSSAPNSSGGTDVYVYFSGSNSSTDWKNNANILSERVPDDWGCDAGSTMRTHRGYMRALTSVAPKMLDALDAELRVQPGNPRVVFCGHSLGGALATMAAAYVACKRPRLRGQLAVVSFGAPQVGDAAFVEFFNRVIPSSTRVVNPLDPVPRLLNVQLVHVKGHYPVGTLSLDSTLKAHSLDTYRRAVETPRAVSVLGPFAPAAVVAVLIGGYVLWQWRKHR